MMKGAMLLRLLTSIGWLAILAPLAAQPKPWTPPKTPWGDPDLQGVWPGTEMVGTPLQRDPSLGTRAVLSDQEFAQWVEGAKKKFATNPANSFASVGAAAQ